MLKQSEHLGSCNLLKFQLHFVIEFRPLGFLSIKAPSDPHEQGRNSHLNSEGGNISTADLLVLTG